MSPSGILSVHNGTAQQHQRRKHECDTVTLLCQALQSIWVPSCSHTFAHHKLPGKTSNCFLYHPYSAAVTSPALRPFHQQLQQLLTAAVHYCSSSCHRSKPIAQCFFSGSGTGLPSSFSTLVSPLMASALNSSSRVSSSSSYFSSLISAWGEGSNFIHC